VIDGLRGRDAGRGGAGHAHGDNGGNYVAAPDGGLAVTALQGNGSSSIGGG